MSDVATAVQERRCPHCDNANPVGNKFCVKCGKPFDITTPLTQESPPIPAPPTAAPKTAPLAQTMPTGWAPTPGRHVRWLETRADSWADVLADLGHTAGDLRDGFCRNLLARQFPGLIYNITPFRAQSITTDNQRDYLVIYNQHRGEVMTVYIRQFGRDLYVAWDLWIKRRYNWLVLGIVLFMALMFSIPFGSAVGAAASIFNRFFGLLVGLIAIGVLTVLVSGVIGWGLSNIALFFTGGRWTYFIRRLSDFDVHDINALELATHDTLLKSAHELGISTDLFREKSQFGSESLGRTI